MPFAIGQNVGPYQILEQLGQGGMATVYKAYHPALDRFVAIKVLHTAFREDATFLARFTREARVVAKLEHPHIVPIFDFSECDGQPYLVMKFIEGETLKSRLAQAPMGAEEAIRIVDAIGSALAYAHSKGILHRDIKPSNILITPEANIYLADFGLARIAQSTEVTLSSDMFMGTPHYISPEQAQGLKNLDAGTDIYSLGVVMYELAVGRVPFNADTPFSIIHDHIFTPLPLPRSINPKVPAEVERVLLKGLAKERADRYGTVEELVAAFISATRSALGNTASPKKESRPGIPATPMAAPPHANASGTASGGTRPPVGKKKNKRKGLPWWGWGILAMGICLCLVLSLWILTSISNQKNLKGTQTAEAGNTLILTTTVQITSTESVVSESPIPPDSAEAWKLFLTGMDLYKSGNKEDGVKQFQAALDRIPASRTGLILLAVQRLTQAGDWITAGNYCVKGLQATQTDPALNRVSDEVFYRVAAELSGDVTLKQLLADHPDLPIANLAYARWLIQHTDRTSEAKQLIDKIRTQSPGILEEITQAVLGEYQLYTKDITNGINTLNGVLQDPNSPPWLKAEAQRLIKSWS